MKIFARGFAEIRGSWRAYAWLNIALYGSVIAMIALTTIFPSLHSTALSQAEGQLDRLGPVSQAYASGSVPHAAAITFITNLIIGALLSGVLPSLVLPFFAIAFNLYRFGFLGVLFAPVGGQGLELVPHYLTLLIELQAYILICLGSYILTTRFLRPAAHGHTGRAQAYRRGLLAFARLSPLVVVLLAVGAVYEAIEIIYLVPRLA